MLFLRILHLSGAKEEMVMRPLFQSTLGLLSCNHGSPKMMCSFPNAVTRNRVSTNSPPIERVVLVS